MLPMEIENEESRMRKELFREWDRCLVVLWLASASCAALISTLVWWFARQSSRRMLRLNADPLTQWQGEIHETVSKVYSQRQSVLSYQSHASHDHQRRFLRPFLSRRWSRVMTDAVAKKCCVKCEKGTGQALCDGCERWFCVKHFLDHRQELSQQLDALLLERDQLQQHLCTESDAPERHPLLTRVDQWEAKSIARIKQVANTVRSQLTAPLARTRRVVQYSLRPITAELKKNQGTEDFNEIDLRKWLSQLKELREQLDKPVMVELIDDEDEKSSTHIPLIHLRIKQTSTGKTSGCEKKESGELHFTTRWSDR